MWTNYISPIINTKNPQKKTLEKFKLDANYKNEHCDFKSKTIYGAENLRMPVHLSISGTVCSFLDKYYNIQTDIQKTISDNKKMENDIYAVLPKITKLPISVSTKQENDEYNKIVKSNNILINLYNQQQPNKESRLRQFKHLKGFPSFPIVEKQKQEVDYVELDNLLSPHLENAKLFWDTINIEQFQNAMAHFCGRIIYKLFKYYYKIDAIEPDSKNFKYILKDWKKADIKIIIERIDKKIKNIKEKLKQSDKRSEKALIEWYRGKSLIFFEYLRQNNDKTQFAKVRAEFDLKSSINAGFISKDNKERKVLEITGIAPKYKCALLIIDNQFVLAYNPYDQGKFIIKNNGKYEGYIKDTKTGLTAKNKLEIDENSTLFLPLAFGKRYGREYLYNIQNNFKNGGLTLNNARIIKDGEDYFVAITFTKLKGNKYKDIEYEHIIGVDRGEILPVAITITDLNGKIIENPELDICKNFSEKQKKIDKQKRKENRQKANYNEKLKKKAKNLSKATIEKIGAALLYYAIKYKALIIMEDLNREFGINPIMAVRQYSKIEDYLARKLKENGLMYGEVVKNTRNGLLGKVIAQHTSKTCSHCGSVFSSEKIRMLADKLYKKNDIWHVELEGKEISLNINYEKYVKSKGRYEQFNANTLIEELKQKDTKKNKELIETTLLNALNPRKTQAEFICPICGHKENADEQASLNIARRWIFEKEGEIKGDKGIKSSLEKEKYKENKISYWQAWEEFCKRKANEWNQRN